MKHFTIAVIVIAALAVAGCKKGDTGPAGPQGAKGPTGTANMQEIIVTNVTWDYSTTYSIYNKYITFAGITQNVLDSGAVLNYWRGTGSNRWIIAPDPYDNITVVEELGQSYFIGGTSNYGNSDFKVVIIAPEKMQGHTKKEWQSMSYTQAAQLLSLNTQ